MAPDANGYPGHPRPIPVCLDSPLPLPVNWGSVGSRIPLHLSTENNEIFRFPHFQRVLGIAAGPYGFTLLSAPDEDH